MGNALHVVVCAGTVPDPLQTLEPITGPNGPGVKNEMMLPAVLDPCLLYTSPRGRAQAPARLPRRCSCGNGR